MQKRMEREPRLQHVRVQFYIKRSYKALVHSHCLRIVFASVYYPEEEKRICNNCNTQRFGKNLSLTFLSFHMQNISNV
jgi:hypothetical protein